ncbi:hypothetical protein TBR22_A15280 [Luteitalea sp. TBR-22]|uniref:DUF4097 family beta strand repeat-containing protein n=1 Tax=Luteitalea sp. TBR-22 TaxID=2802971 RepID=UPI001AF91999|nr:DUF4097 family beta strand repeat-containing protein [Luteitalea sp. TBR-22]BCS32318.1 hypothetical protein TBR22_A15280 [Luteitalea sp. TBR-22]
MSVRLSSLFAASLITLAPALAAAQPVPFERTLSVGASPALDVSTGSGNVVVQSGGSSIVIKGTVEPRKGWGAPANAADIARQVAAKPPIVQAGDSITVGRLDEAQKQAVSISYDIIVPAGTMVAARSGSGNVRVSGVNNAVKATSGSGNVEVMEIGGTVDANSGSGNVTVKGARQAASLSSGSGNIVAILTGKGDVKASTGSGDIKITGAHGLVAANTGSGSIGVEGTPTGDWKVSSASGDVQVALPATQGFVVDARTASGSLDVAAPLTVEGKVNPRHITGTVRGGGPTLRLSTASGDIAVK